MKAAILSIGAAALVFSAAESPAAIGNGSFETGDFNSWTLYNPTGQVSTDYAPLGTYLPAGSLAIVTSAFSHSPTQGTFFAN